MLALLLVDAMENKLSYAKNNKTLSLPRKQTKYETTHLHCEQFSQNSQPLFRFLQDQTICHFFDDKTRGMASPSLPLLQCGSSHCPAIDIGPNDVTGCRGDRYND